MVLNDQGAFAGAVGFNSLGLCSEFAHHLCSRFGGQGFARAASRLALNWSFAEGAEPIENFIGPANAASIRLAERLGS